jgi:DNA invertase Pin-like site-specific DNA recombinase
MPRVVGLTRASTIKQKDSPEVQAHNILLGAERLKLPVPEIIHEPLGTSGVSTLFRKRPEGRRLWHQLNKGDILIVASISRLGRNCRDIRNTIDHFHDRGVRVVVLDLFGGQGIDLQGPIGTIVVAVMSAVAQMEAEAISERTRQHYQWAKASGLAVGDEWGRRKVPIPGEVNSHGNPRCKFEWDMKFLDAMARFIHELRKGRKIREVIDEWHDKHLDWRGRPFLDVVAQVPHARCWSRKFVRLLKNGDLPAPFCVPGVANHFDRGLSRFHWLDNPDEIQPRRKKPKPAQVDRSQWTADQWRRWYAEEQDEPEEETVEALRARIIRQLAEQEKGNGTSH